MRPHRLPTGIVVSPALCAALTAFLAVVTPAVAQQLTTVRITSSVVRPLYVTAPQGDYSHIYIVSQRDANTSSGTTTGRIKIFNLQTGTLNDTDFLAISGVSGNSEQGILGLAFHPDYAENGYFYVYYTEGPPPGFDVLARYRRSAANPEVADPASGTIILRMADPYNNHNGGWVAFGPDRYLYLTIGDGGSQNDPNNRGQDVTDDLFGNILRLDIDGPNNVVGDDDDDDYPADTQKNYAIPPDNPFVGITGDDEIWDYGLRNPWRAAFDRATNDLWIADVGQDLIEEIDFEPAGSHGGVNYGWRCMEANSCTGRTGCTCNDPSLTLPIYQYNHTSPNGRCSITGGYVYRGCAIPWLRGTYFFADYCTAEIWSLRYTPQTGVTEFTDRTAELDPPTANINLITSFGEDARGEMYICDQGGEVFKIVPANAPDCNANGQPDWADIAAGRSQDCNCNGIPDSCNNDAQPVVLVPPASQFGCLGRPVTFSVSAMATAPVTYQWRKNGVPITGATNPAYSISSVVAADVASYDVVIHDSCGMATSTPATLALQPLGDANCDGRFDNFDIDPFVLALVDGQETWSLQYNCNFLCATDIDGSGSTTNFDIDPFIALLLGL